MFVLVLSPPPPLRWGRAGSGFIKGDQFVTSHSDWSQETGEKGRNSAAICTSAPDWLSKTEDHNRISLTSLRQHHHIIIIILLLESPCPSVRWPGRLQLEVKRTERPPIRSRSKYHNNGIRDVCSTADCLKC